jgi:hypothetical protein
MSVAAAAAPVSLTFMSIGAMRFAIPTLRVAHVEERALRAGIAEPESVDLRLRFGMDAKAPTDASVVLGVTERDGRIHAELPIAVVDVPSSEVHPLPVYLSDWAARHDVTAIVVTNESISFLLDVDTLLDRCTVDTSPTETSA